MKLSELQNILRRMEYYNDKKITDLSDEDIEDFIRLRKRYDVARTAIESVVKEFDDYLKEENDESN